jgi:hypothetical protein
MSHSHIQQFLPIRSGGGVQVVTEESRRFAILFFAYQVGTPAEVAELVQFYSRAAPEYVGIEQSAIAGERAPMTPRRKRKRVHGIDSTNKSGLDKGPADNMASGVAAIASVIANSRQVRGGKAAKEAANADELLSLLQKATDSYSSKINPAMKEQWRNQIGRLEESLDIFEKEETPSTHRTGEYRLDREADNSGATNETNE